MNILIAFKTIHCFLCFIGCSFNALLIYMSIFKSPPCIQTYSLFITNFALTDFLACFFDFLNQLRIVPAGRTLAYFSYGPCKWLGYRFCEISYRYYILFHKTPKKITVFFILLLVYSPSFAQAIIYGISYSSHERIREIIAEKYPNYDIKNVTITGTEDVLTWGTLFTIFHMTLPITPTYISIIILSRKIIKRLTIRGIKVSKNTKNLHGQLLMALTYQALLPILYVFGVVSYSIGQLGIYNDPLMEYLTFTSFIIIPILSPISSFIFITPYRHFISRCFNKIRNRKVENSTSVHEAGNTNHISMLA